MGKVFLDFLCLFECCAQLFSARIVAVARVLKADDYFLSVRLSVNIKLTFGLESSVSNF